MRSHRTGIIGWVAGLAVFAAVFLVFAPVQVGGSTSYVATEGISMLPKLHTGYLAVVRAGPPYGVGDAVLYNSPVLHRPVLHRIIAVHDGQYSLQGDNNDFVDPGTVPASAIVGQLWFHIPRVGGWVGWLSAPAHASMIAVVAAMFLLLGGKATKRRRDRRRTHARRPETAAQQTMAPEWPAGPERAELPTPAVPVPVAARDFGLRGLQTAHELPDRVAPAQPAPKAAPKEHSTKSNLQTVAPSDFMFNGVNLHRAWPPLAGAMLLAIVLTLVAFAVPAHRSAQDPGAFNQIGNFSYVSQLVAPNAAYPTGFAQTGDPLLLDLFHKADMRFNYRFNSRLPHEVRGTIALNTVFTAATTLHRTFVLTKAIPFVGDTATINGSVDLVQSRAFFDQLSADSGATGADYLVDLQAVVTLTGVVDGKPIHETFNPVLPFTYNHQLIKLATPAASAGAAADPSSDTNALAAILSPEQSGSLEHQVGNTVNLAALHVNVLKLRVLGLLLIGLIFAGMVVLAITRPPIRARRQTDLISKRYGSLLVPVVAINPDNRVVIELPDFHSLARLAQHYEHLIMEEHRGRDATYAVDEDGRLYIYRIMRRGPGARARTGDVAAPVRFSRAAP